MSDSPTAVIIRPRTAGLVVTLLALLIALLPPAAPAAAQPDDTVVDDAAAWLVEQYQAGEVTGRGGLTDLIIALLAAGTDGVWVQAAANDLRTDIAAYVGAGGEDPGQLGKALLGLRLSGDDGRDVDGVDLEQAVRDRIVADGADAGRFEEASVFVQSLAVMALTTTDGGAPGSTTAWLTAQRCPDGGFPFAPDEGEDASTPCDTPGDGDVDATALAVQALLADPSAADDVAGAVEWLLEQQADDGGFGDFGVNANSSGLAAQALRATGEAAAADAAAAFVAGLQITDGPDAGAIRFRPDDDGSLFLATVQGILAFGAPAITELGATTPAPPEQPIGDPCPDASGVTVVVDLTFFDEGIRIGCYEGPQQDGLVALSGAGFDITTGESDFGRFVCAIEGLPELACDQPFEGQFWGYFAGQPDGSWEAHQVGASDTTPGPGDVEGWSYSEGEPPGIPAPTAQAPSGAVTRLAGDSRIATAIAISQHAFADGTAGGVVLARDDEFADALAGAPLAAGANGPLLITPSAALPDAVFDEIRRVLSPNGRVNILGGVNAISEDIEAALIDEDFLVERLSGDDRVATAIAIAERLGDPDNLLITTGDNFPDALAAGAGAVASGDGAVLLTSPGVPHPVLDEYLAELPDATVYAVGGPAAAAYPDAIPVVGQSRVETAVLVAQEFIDSPGAVGLARQDNFADALAGGPRIALLGGPLLLTDGAELSPMVADYLCATPTVEEALIFGGTAAIDTSVDTAVEGLLAGSGCG